MKNKVYFIIVMSILLTLLSSLVILVGVGINKKIEKDRYFKDNCTRTDMYEINGKNSGFIYDCLKGNKK